MIGSDDTKYVAAVGGAVASVWELVYIMADSARVREPPLLGVIYI